MHCGFLQAGIALVLTATPASAAGTHFGFKQIIVAGSTNVSAYAINNKSAITGVYADAAGTHGFIQHGSMLTVLPPVGAGCGGSPVVPFPTAINAAGDVVGTAYCSAAFGFLWRNGNYVQNGYVNLNYGGTVGINSRGEEFYDVDDGEGIYSAYAGYPGAFVPIDQNSSISVYVSGLTNDGVVAFSTGGLLPGVLTYDQGVYTEYLPPGAFSSSSAVINDHGEVAGVYLTPARLARGFVYQAGQYTSFFSPDNPDPLSVQAINNAGRVVGTFSSGAKNIQRAFLFNGTKLSVIGDFPLGDWIRIGLNDEGTMLISDYSSSQGTSTTWRVLCGGDGC